MLSTYCKCYINNNFLLRRGPADRRGCACLFWLHHHRLRVFNTGAMPLYELFCLAKPQLKRLYLTEMISLAGRAVLQHGGVITDIKSFGEQKLAYDIRKPGEVFDKVSIIITDAIKFEFYMPNVALTQAAIISSSPRSFSFSCRRQCGSSLLPPTPRS